MSARAEIIFIKIHVPPKLVYIYIFYRKCIKIDFLEKTSRNLEKVSRQKIYPPRESLEKARESLETTFYFSQSSKK